MPETPFGCPNALSVSALSTAAGLAGRGEERSAASWLLLRALLHRRGVEEAAVRAARARRPSLACPRLA
jgi:hypothetical protein